MKNQINAFLIFVFVFAVSSCSSTPTGRRQLRLMPADQMAELGDQSFAQLKQKQSVSYNSSQVSLVRCVTSAVLQSLGENPQAWEIEVFQDSSPNAFALPGKNVGVHTGMLDLVKNQHQLAAVIGHEIGHVLAHHGNERVSQGLLTDMGLQVADMVLGKNSQNDQLIMGALGLGAQFGYLLPFSRKQEKEADVLGVEYMAKAGFDPREAAELWKLMQAHSGGGPPEFLSTHPSTASRINHLTEISADYMPIYQAANKPHCQ